LSPDPYAGSVDPAKPQSWNRYSYASSDPVNSNDPTGLCIIDGYPCFSTVGTGNLEGETSSYDPTDDNWTGIGLMFGSYYQHPLPNDPGNDDGDGYNPALWFFRQMFLAENMALNTLLTNSDCAGLFAGSAMVRADFGGSPAEMLAAYMTHGLITDNTVFPGPDGGQPFSGPGVGAVTTAGGALMFNGIRTSVPQIVINAGGFFFNGGALNGTPVQQIPGSGFQGLTTVSQVQETVVLHELLHAAGVFGADSGPGVPAGASAANTAIVVRNCTK
jgi:hypothetical protein